MDKNKIELISTTIPPDAYDIEVFKIEADENGKLFAYIGYKVSNVNFEFNVVPFTEPQKYRSFYTGEEVLKHLNHLMDMKSSELDKYTNEDEMITMDWFDQFEK